MGHATEDCWENPKNEGKRYKSWISRKKRKAGEATGSVLYKLRKESVGGVVPIGRSL